MGQRPFGSSTVSTNGQLWLGGGVTLVRASLCGSEVLLLGDGSPAKGQEEGGGSLGHVEAWHAIPGHCTVCHPSIVGMI